MMSSPDCFQCRQCSLIRYPLRSPPSFLGVCLLAVELRQAVELLLVVELLLAVELWPAVELWLVVELRQALVRWLAVKLRRFADFVSAPEVLRPLMLGSLSA